MQDDSELLQRCGNASQCRQITISHQVPLDWALPLYGYVMPVIVAITLATNSFIVLVLSHKYLRTPTNYVLLAMAVSELLTGLSCVPWLLYYYTLGGFVTEAQFGLPAFWCTMFPYMAFILPSIFHAIATFLTVYLALQRYIYICVPKLVHSQCTFRRSKQVIMLICIVALWLYAPDAVNTYNRSFTVIKSQNVSHRICARMETGLMRAIGSNLYYYIVFGAHALLVHTLPSVLLVFFTWKLIRAIRIADQRHANLLSRSTRRRFSDLNEASDTVTPAEITISNGKRDSTTTNIYKARGSIVETKRVQGLKQNTRMLLAVIILFLLTEIPAAVIFTLHVVSVSLKFTRFVSFKYYEILNILLIVRNVLIVISYPFRFAIYCGMSQQFRDVVRQIFLRQARFWHLVSENNLNNNMNDDINGGLMGNGGQRRCSSASQQYGAGDRRESGGGGDDRRYFRLLVPANGTGLASTMITSVCEEEDEAPAVCHQSTQCDMIQKSSGHDFDPFYGTAIANDNSAGDEFTGLIRLRSSIADIFASLPSSPTEWRDKSHCSRSTQCGGGQPDPSRRKASTTLLLGSALMESSIPVVLSVVS